MSIPFGEVDNQMRNSDLVIAKDDLASISENYLETNQESVPEQMERANSVLDHQMNRKPAVS